MEVRIATPQDTQSLVAMAASFRNHLERQIPTDAQFEASIRRLLTSEDAEFSIAMDEGGSAGYVLLRFRYSMWTSGLEATLEDLFVEPRARRGGVGEQLVRFALRRARERGCVSICLDTNEKNAASTRIYERLGFQSLSRRWNGRQVFYRLSLETSEPSGCPGGTDAQGSTTP